MDFDREIKICILEKDILKIGIQFYPTDTINEYKYNLLNERLCCWIYDLEFSFLIVSFSFGNSFCRLFAFSIPSYNFSGFVISIDSFLFLFSVFIKL